MYNRSEKLKEIILQQYSSIRMFAKEVGMPHGTLVSALNNDIDGMAWSRLSAICDKLQIDPATLEPIKESRGRITEKEKRLLAYFKLLNPEGQEKVETYLKDISMIPAYYEKKI